MILKPQLCLLFLFSFTSFLGQNKEIEIVETKSAESVLISIKNNTKEIQEVTLIIKGSGFEKVQSPVVKIIEVNDLIVFCELKRIENKELRYNLSYSYVSKPKVIDTDSSKPKKESSNKNGLSDNLNQLKNSSKGKDDLSKGIYVFAKDGCTRCELTLNYLEENKIKHKVFYISKNKEAKELMSSKLTEINFYGKLTMPVIVVDDKISHSHKDLKNFLKTLSN